MTTKGRLARAVTMGMAVVVVACAKKEEETQANIEVQTEPAPPPPVTIDLVPASGATVMGTVTATHATDKVTVQLGLSGLNDKDYDATMRYGDCTIAPKYLKSEPKGDSAATTGTAAEHKLGDDFMTIRLDKEGSTATGEATVDNDELRAEEPAYIVITQNDAMVACADLKGHGNVPAPTMGSTTMPADTMKK